MGRGDDEIFNMLVNSGASLTQIGHIGNHSNGNDLNVNSFQGNALAAAANLGRHTILTQIINSSLKSTIDDPVSIENKAKQLVIH